MIPLIPMNIAGLVGGSSGIGGLASAAGGFFSNILGSLGGIFGTKHSADFFEQIHIDGVADIIARRLSKSQTLNELNAFLRVRQAKLRKSTSKRTKVGNGKGVAYIIDIIDQIRASGNATLSSGVLIGSGVQSNSFQDLINNVQSGIDNLNNYGAFPQGDVKFGTVKGGGKKEEKKDNTLMYMALLIFAMLFTPLKKIIR